jgi:thiamine-phosphate pyrophosphorylase
VRPLPRLQAVTDARVLADPDLGQKAASIAAVGPVVALHLRDRSASSATLAEFGRRFVALTRPPEASVIVNGRPDLARALGAQGVQLGADDLPVSAARQVLGRGWIGRSVHSLEEARQAVSDGADYLLLGAIFPTPSHPDRAPLGVKVLEQCVALGSPVIAIGGITAGKAGDCHRAGAWGVAAIRALWDAADPLVAARALTAPWEEE